MRKRSELGKKSSTKEEVPPKKTSAAERTVPLPMKGSDVEVQCSEPSCNVISIASNLTKRDDGMLECSACGMPIEDPGAGATVAPVGAPGKNVTVPSTKTESSTRVDEEPKMTPFSGITGFFCGECAGDLVMVRGGLTWPCGHTDAPAVHKPEHAKRIDPSASRSRPRVLPSQSGDRVETMRVEETESGPRLHLEWGPAMFRVAEFSNFHTGTIAVTQPIVRGSLVDAARQARKEMRTIADEDFREKLQWYLEKLGLVKDALKR